jgi:hypothetical protein
MFFYGEKRQQTLDERMRKIHDRRWEKRFCWREVKGFDEISRVYRNL